MATASYDGSIKIWSVDNMSCSQNLNKPKLNLSSMTNFKEHVVYSIAWSPTSKDRLISTNSNGEIILWNVATGKLLSEICPGSSSAIFKCDWNKLDSTYLASGSSDSYW